MKVTIVGGGSIGSALARRFLVDRVCGAQSLCVVETHEEKRNALQDELKCSVVERVDASALTSDVLVLAVKPRDASAACASLSGMKEKQALVISVMAGISLKTLKEMLGNEVRIVRSMPSIPVRVALGMTVYIGNEKLSAEDYELVERIFAAAGKSIRVKDEALLDASTAVSGSGPAYVFYLIEKMIEAAQDLGFSETESEILVAETFRGATELWRSTGVPAQELRRQVTTPGGTTAAAFEVFDAAKVGEALREGIQRACTKSKELGQGVNASAHSSKK